MSEHVLAAYRLGPDLYRLGQYTPVSIRDQIVRAHYLVHALWDEGLIDEDSSLGIVGAGAAGTTAAIVAADLGLTSILLVEKDRNAVSLQGKAKSRWLDPVQYDWPARHWTEGRWPIHDDGFTLTAQDFAFPAISAGAAPFIASFLQSQLARHLGAAVTPAFDSTVQRVPRDKAGGRRVEYMDAAGVQQKPRVALVILTVGFGSERSSLRDDTVPGTPGTFSGLQFWDDDKFEQANFGMTSVPNGVLVSGSGDGALQDFVRLATGKRSVKAVANPILNMLPGAFVRKVADVWQWEELTMLQQLVAPLPIDDCEVLRRIHVRYARLVDEMFGLPQGRHVEDYLQRITSGRPIDKLRLAVKADHFSGCYPLNRLTALLIARFIESTSGVHPVLYDTGVRSTVAHGHACSTGCWGQTHEVALATGATCDVKPDEVGSWPDADCDFKLFDGLVVRHGIDPTVYLGTRKLKRKLAPLATPRHLP
jgi:hypothetical protein